MHYFTSSAFCKLVRPLRMFFVTSAIVVATGCGPEVNPTSPSTVASFRAPISPATAIDAPTGLRTMGAIEVKLCHRSNSTKLQFVLLSVTSSAIDAHMAHGDGQIGGPVPGQTGMQFDPACNAVVPPVLPDTTPPAFVGVSFSPTTVDVSGGAATTTVSAHITDVGTGVQQYRIFLTGPTNVLLECGAALVPPQSGTIQDGTWTCEITFPAGSAAGMWRFSSADAHDIAGNSTVISGADAARLAEGVTVTN